MRKTLNCDSGSRTGEYFFRSAALIKITKIGYQFWFSGSNGKCLHIPWELLRIISKTVSLLVQKMKAKFLNCFELKQIKPSLFNPYFSGLCFIAWLHRSELFGHLNVDYRYKIFSNNFPLCIYSGLVLFWLHYSGAGYNLDSVFVLNPSMDTLLYWCDCEKPGSGFFPRN